MAVTFEQIEPELRRLREFVLNDLDRILDQPVGGNYAAVAVALCAYDAIAKLEGGANARGERPFADSLPQAWRPVAPTLYNALRNGLVHTYETKTVLASGRQIELVLSWRERPHLTFEDDRLFLNVRDIVSGLGRAFNAFTQRLRDDAELRDRFWQRSQRARTLDVLDPRETEAWRRLLPGPRAGSP